MGKGYLIDMDGVIYRPTQIFDSIEEVAEHVATSLTSEDNDEKRPRRPLRRKLEMALASAA